MFYSIFFLFVFLLKFEVTVGNAFSFNRSKKENYAKRMDYIYLSIFHCQVHRKIICLIHSEMGNSLGGEINTKLIKKMTNILS